MGLIKIDFFGEYLDFIGGSEQNNDLQIKHAIKTNFYDDIDLIGICDEQLKELKKKMKYNIEIEDYMECKEIKYKIEKVRLYGKKVYELESEKMIALNNEDYSKALSIKNIIDKIKIDILNIPNISLSKMNDNRLALSDRYLEQKYLKKTEPFLSSIEGKPKIFKLKNNNIINKNLTIDNNISNTTNSIDNIISYDETILPTVINKYNPCNGENKIINELEKGELEKLPENILSEYEGLAIFSNRSWVSDYGTYYRNSNKFVLKEGKELDNIDEYVNRINQRVSNAFSISNLIVGNDYYSYILGN